MNLIYKLLKLAKGDLDDARVLYQSGNFRNSYFLFQQSTEKANKALGLFSEVISEDELKKVGHDSSRIYRKGLKNQQDQLKRFDGALIGFPRLHNHEFIKKMDRESLRKYLLSSTKQIDSFKDADLVRMPASDLNILLRDLRKLETAKIQIPKKAMPELKDQMLMIADWIGMFGTPEATLAKAEFEEFVNEPKKFVGFASILRENVIPAYIELIFVGAVFWTCAIITVQHNQLTRYTDGRIDPDKVYVKTLPVVNKQPKFMDFLDKALQKFNRILTTGCK